MELKNRWSLRRVVPAVFGGCVILYLLVGLTPAQATDFEPATEIEIPSIGLHADVAPMTMRDGVLKTPDAMVGSYSRAKNKTFLVGHSVGVFQNLSNVNVGDSVVYDLVHYTVTSVDVVEKSEIKMDELLLPSEKDTIMIMTCAGELLGGGDATHRLIITASAQ